MATIMAGVALVLMEWFRLGALIKFISYPVIAMKKFARKDVRLILSGVQPQPMKLLYNSGFIEEIGLENVCANLDEALLRAAALTDA